MSLPTDAAQMARDGGIETRKLADNAFSTDKLFQIQQGQFIGRDNLQSGTGNVNATQTYPDISLTSALSAPFNATTAWRSLSAYLNQVKNTNTSSSFYLERFGSFPGVGAHATAVVAPNGLIYMPASNNSVGRIINPINNTVTTYGSFFPSPNGAIHGGALTSNGLIYCTPYNQSTASITNPSNNTTTTFGTFPGTASAWGAGAVLAPNGKVYMIPSSGTVFAVVDPLAANPTSIQFFGTNNQNCIAGTLAPNGKIYCGATSSYTYGIIIDPATNTLSSYGPIPSQQYAGGSVLAPSGRIYMIPVGSTGNTVVVVIDPSTNSVVKTFSGITGNGTTPYNGSCIDQFGRIFLVPFDSTTGLVIDTNNDSIQTYGNSSFFPGSQAYEGAILAPNGKVYFVPYSATIGLCVNTNSNNNWNLNVTISPHFNRTNN